MDALAYRLPALQDEGGIAEFLDECFKAAGKGVVYCHDLLEEDYPTWVRLIEKNASEGNGKWGRSLLYLCRNRACLVGVLAIRYELSPELAAEYGHIGYAVRPSKRNRGYATQMLKHALEICRQQGLESVRLGCLDDNVPSAAVIEKCGGVPVTGDAGSIVDIANRYFSFVL